MKILAHSLVPVNPMPYMHLGYIAATTHALEKPNTAYYSAVGLLIVGVIVLMRYQGVSRLRSALGGFVSIVALIACIWIIGYSGPLRYRYPWHVTTSRMRQITQAIYMLNQDEKPIPGTLSAMQKHAQGQYPVPVYDGWLRPFRYYVAGEGNSAAAVAVSPGADERFDTADDYLGAYGATAPALLRFPTEEVGVGPHNLAAIRETLTFAVSRREAPSTSPISLYCHVSNRETEETKRTWYITSAGADTRPGTEDDLHLTFATTHTSKEAP